MTKYTEYPLNELKHYSTFLDFARGIGEDYNGSIAITTYSRSGEEHSHTYAELTADSLALAAALKQRGYAKRHIAIVSESGYEWVVCFLGITGAGATAVMVDTEQNGEGMAAAVMRADSAAVMCSASNIEELYSVRELDGLTCFTVGGENGETLDTLIAEGKETLSEDPGLLDADPPTGDTIAAIAFTSGTTSASKAVMLSNAAMLENSYSSMQMVWLADKVYAPLPLYHTYGLTGGVVNCLSIGVNICLNGNHRTLARDLMLFDPGTMLAVPLMVAVVVKLLAAGDGKKTPRSGLFGKKNTPPPRPKGLEQLRHISCGGAHISQSAQTALDRYGIVFLEGYGITECSPMVCTNRFQEIEPGSVGLPMPRVELCIQDDEILVRGANLMAGYYKDEEQTAEAMRDGWFHTGDNGYIDKNGFVFITGRRKNVIVFNNGKKVAPEEIEERVGQIPVVCEVMAYGVANGEAADDVRLAVMVYPDPELTSDMSQYEILDTLQREIDKINLDYPSYKQIEMVNLRKQPFEKTSTKKIRRQ